MVVAVALVEIGEARRFANSNFAMLHIAFGQAELLVSGEF